MTQSTALFLSIACESLVAWLVVAAWHWGNPWRAALAATVGTCVTHWAAWSAVIWLMDSINYAAVVVVVEAAVVLVESLAYRWIAYLSWNRALLASLIANAASTGLGLGVQILGIA
jgi:hypothetical protein